MNWKLLGVAIAGVWALKKALSNKNENVKSSSSDYEEDYGYRSPSPRSYTQNSRPSKPVKRREETDANKWQYEMKIVGSIQCKGVKTINKTIIVDRTQMLMLTGASRREALEDWVRANYFGADPGSGRNLVAKIVRVIK